MSSYQLAQDLEQAFEQIGMTMMTDDFAAKLLAYVYVMGGGNEAVVLHKGLNAGIGVAQQKANLKGGEIPNAKMLPLIQMYIKELELAEKNPAHKEYWYKNPSRAVPWLKEIYTRYELVEGRGPANPNQQSRAKKDSHE